MTKFLFHFWIGITTLFILPESNLFAQITPVPIPSAKELKCNQTGVWYLKLKSPHCYKKPPYNNREQALQQFKKDLLAQVKCTNICPDTADFHCKPKFLHFNAGFLDNSAPWCSRDSIAFTWKCTDCVEKTEDRKILETDKSPTPKIQIAPIPSTGIVNLTISNITKSGIPELKITNISGHEVLHKKYKEVNSDSHSTSIDLSQLPSGIYFASFFLNDQFYDTQRIIIQH